MKYTFLFLAVIILIAGCSSSDSSSSGSNPNANTTGVLDSSFGTNGSVTIDFGVSDEYFFPSDNAILPNGKIVVVGNFNFSSQTFCGLSGVVMLNADGTLDTNFSYDGKITFSLDTSAYAKYFKATGIGVLPDGKIIVLSSTNGSKGFVGSTLTQYFYTSSFRLSKFNSDGSVDTSFGTNGTLNVDLETLISTLPLTNANSRNVLCIPNAINVNSDGSFVVEANSFSSTYDGASFVHKIALVKFNSDGTFYNSFGTNGKAFAILGGTPSLDLKSLAGYTYREKWTANMCTDSSNKILVEFTDIDSDFNTNNKKILRFNSDGSQDISFGINGGFNLPTDLVNNSLVNYSSSTNLGYSSPFAVKPDGGLVVGGGKNYANGKLFYAGCYTNGGQIDGSFGTNGFFTTTFGSTSFDQIYALGIQSTGKIVLLGITTDQTYGQDIVMCRLNSNGSLDTSFGNSGKIIDTQYPLLSLDSNYQTINKELLIDSNNKIYIFCDNINHGLTIKRYN